jgi:Conserved in the green lineage and diatoms 27
MVRSSTAQRQSLVCLAEPDKSDRDTIIDYERLEVAVPGPQRPVNELKQVKDGILFSWATLEGAAFFTRLATVFVFVFAFLGGPIAYQTFDPVAQPAQWALAGSLGALLVTTVVTLRIYLGWAYVGERLLSATIEYEVWPAYTAFPPLSPRACCLYSSLLAQ